MKLEDSLAQADLKSLGVGDYAYTEELVPQTLNHYQDWLLKGHQGPLKYLADERKTLREDLRHFFPEVKSVLVFLFPYKKKKESQRLAGFITGFEEKDYHEVLEERLQDLGKKLQGDFPELKFKVTIDKHPVLERDLAYRAGLGWFGKSSMLIHPKLGTFHLIGTLLLSQTFAHPLRKKEGEYCGACQRCMDSCPTKAIVAPKVLEANKCISCFTLELFKEALYPQGYQGQSYRAGCDLCQEVCPWNKKHLVEGQELTALEKLFEKDDEELRGELESLSKKDFLTRFRGTSFYRLGKRGLLKNLLKK